MVKVHHFKLGDKRYSAVMNLNVLDKLAEMAGPAEDGTPLDVNALMAVWSSPYGLMKAFIVMLKEGERMEGRELDIDEDWLRANLAPAENRWLQLKVTAIMVDAMHMETTIGDDEEVDEVLEDLKKKVTKEE